MNGKMDGTMDMVTVGKMGRMMDGMMVGMMDGMMAGMIYIEQKAYICLFRFIFHLEVILVVDFS